MWISQDRAANRPADIPYIRVPKVLDIGPHEPELLYVVSSEFALWDETMQAVEGPYKNDADHRALVSGMCLGHKAKTGIVHLICRVGQSGRHWMEPQLPGVIPIPESATREDWGSF